MGWLRRRKAVGGNAKDQVRVGLTKLKFIVLIEAENRKGVGAIDWMLFMGFNWLMDRIMQWIWPWMAGELELWVVTARDKKLLAWRGNGDAAFQANLATLTSATGATVRRQ